MCTTIFSDETHFEGLMFCEFEFLIRLLTPMTSLKTLPQRSVNLKNDKVYNLLIFHILEVQSNVTAEPKAPRGYEPSDARHQFLAEMPEAKGGMTSLHWQTGLQNRQCRAHRTLGKTSSIDILHSLSNGPCSKLKLNQNRFTTTWGTTMSSDEPQLNLHAHHGPNAKFSRCLIHPLPWWTDTHSFLPKGDDYNSFFRTKGDILQFFLLQIVKGERF